VRSDLKGKGLGRWLMLQVLAYAKSTGLKSVFGEILRENQPMIRLARALGFSITTESPDVVRATLQMG